MGINGQPPLHYITLKQAIEMTTLYRQNRISVLKDEYAKSDILPVCETFSKDSFATFFTNDACKSIRIYYGMSSNLQTHAIIVGVNSEGKDMLPDNNTLLMKDKTENDGDENPILEDADRCPDYCPPPSPLN